MQKALTHNDSQCACTTHRGSVMSIVTLRQACFQEYPKSARCVQNPIGSRNSAVHNAYHTSLRPSSLFEPRHPSLKIVRQRHAQSNTHNHIIITVFNFAWQLGRTRMSIRACPSDQQVSWAGKDLRSLSKSEDIFSHEEIHNHQVMHARMILPQVHLRKPCYDFSFL